MSASDSDYSIDWLASDEEDYDSAVGLSPDHPDRQQASLPQTPSSSSSSSSSRDSPTTHMHIGSTTNHDSKAEDSILKRGSDDSSCGTPANPEDSWVTETQGYTFVGQQRRQSWAFWTTSPNRMDSALSGKQRQARRRAHSPGLSAHREKPKSEGTEEDRLFAHKCTELQCYIQPLSSILHGLQSGRYSERLSSFQESVAIDRIQRITGVLQNPNMGERYISIILKMEEMLHSWFPHVKAQRDQHTDRPKDDSTPAKRQKQYHGTTHPPPPGSLPLCSSEVDVALRVRNAPLPGSYTATHLKWFHTYPICSSKTGTQSQGRPSTCPLPTRRDPGLTQDNAVSSSTDPHTDVRPTRPRRVPLFKISSPCLERLLKAKESIIVPRNTGGGRNEKIWS